MRWLNTCLWVLQCLLALVFLYAGASKLMTSAEALQKFPLPVLFTRFIGVCEVAGALGLVLPSALKVRPWLTPLAAVGLVIVMIGAVSVSLSLNVGALVALVPLIVGLLCAFVAYGRARLVPAGRARSPAA